MKNEISNVFLKIKNVYNMLAVKVIYLQVFLLTILNTNTNVFATEKVSFGESKPVTGTKQLLSDVTTVLYGFTTGILVLVIIICSIARHFAEENEKAKWQKHIRSSLAWGAVGYCASSFVGIIAYYYG